ncbi:PAS domain-containing protein [Paenibacillus pini]|uniref:PAS protein n=1 Tax=Paenibacillus pini JCM 16418 TaxID=1236976 RepID=W7YIA7_9BACL|nr:PAS domain-containing protein [Paenibacillus pini]GAF08187.1 PAS protein [Paenibacillus pini JCM 16418]
MLNTNCSLDLDLEIIQTLQQSIAVINLNGEITFVNHAWNNASIEVGAPLNFNWVGVNYLQIFETLAEQQHIDGLHSIMHNQRSHYQMQMHTLFANQIRWYLVDASPLLKSAGEVQGIVISFSNITRSKLIESELIEALSEIRTLRGLLPICAVCKRIRDEEEIWNSVESFIEKHTHAEFTHDICPECIRRIYPKYSSALDSPL